MPGTKRRKLYRITARACALVVPLALILGCGDSPEPLSDDGPLAINLRWVESYPTERQAAVETGLLWTLSFLGAELPVAEPPPLAWSGDIVNLRLDRAGIPDAALPHWERLLDAMKASGEYRNNGALDVGRFVALTLCSTWHYYALTGANPRYREARAALEFDAEPVAIVESGIAVGNRLIAVTAASSAIAFIAHEGTGSISDGSFAIREHELLTVMPNGQLRFALYGLNGALKPSALQELTAAGKPSKCLWCHETHLLRPFEARSSVAGYRSLGDFEQRLAEQTDLLSRRRAELRSLIDFGREQDHTYAELLYLGFYEPSLERLVREWGIPEDRARAVLSGLPTHAHAEFPLLGEALYRRSDVDALAPYGVLEVPADPREASANEPNLLQ